MKNNNITKDSNPEALMEPINIDNIDETTQQPNITTEPLQKYTLFFDCYELTNVKNAEYNVTVQCGTQLSLRTILNIFSSYCILITKHTNIIKKGNGLQNVVNVRKEVTMFILMNVYV